MYVLIKKDVLQSLAIACDKKQLEIHSKTKVPLYIENSFVAAILMEKVYK
jgi:hypothetical protein